MAWREAVSVQSETEKQGCPVCDGGMDYVTTISVDERAVWSACFYVAGLIRPPGEEGSQRPPPPISDEDMAYFCETVIAPMAMD